MLFADIEPAYQAFTRDLLRRFGFSPGDFHLDMAPGDEMFFKAVLPGYPGRPGAAVHRYVESALRTHDVHRQLADHLGGLAALERVLDPGSGYGRLTRSLVHRIDPSKLWVSDIYPEAIAWQAKTFGVNSVVSVADPADFDIEGDFPLVFSASVFSHLPDGLFQRWLARLFTLVRPGGMLAFSVHDRALAPDGQAMTPAGIGYQRWSESGSLDPGVYGMSYVTEAFVEQAVADACGREAARGLRRFPRALFENQDLYVVGGRGRDLRSLQVLAPPLAGVQRFGPPGAPWKGWGLELNPGHRIVRAELFMDGRRVGEGVLGDDAGGVAQYFPASPNSPVSWSFPPAAGDGERLMRVELTSDTGRKAYAYGMPGVGDGAAAPRI